MTGRIKKFILLAGDFSLLWAALFVAVALREQEFASSHLLIRENFGTFLGLFAGWLIVFAVVNLYDLRELRNNLEFFILLGKALFVNALISTAFFYFIPGLAIQPKTTLFLMLGVALVLLLTWRRLFNALIGASFLQKKTLCIGWDTPTLELVSTLETKPQLGYQIHTLVKLAAHTNPVLPPMLLARERTLALARLPLFVEEHGIECLIVSPEAYAEPGLSEVLYQCLVRGAKCLDVSSLFEAALKRIPLTLLSQLWLLEYGIETKRSVYELPKRLIDLAVATLLGVVFFIPGLVIAFAIKWESEGPVFFRQKRLGKGGREFWLLKFRSMIVNAEQLGGFKDSSDRRLTRVGKIIRRTHLDELPQIINIMEGEMSFVGPRPERPEYAAALRTAVPFYEMRLLAPPGITGWAQVNMLFDASVEDAPEKLRYDLYYIKHRSLLLDIGIMIKTIRILLRGRGR